MPQTPRPIALLLAALTGVVGVGGLVAFAPAASAQEAGPLGVALAVDQAHLVIDLDENGNPHTPPVLNYEVRVSNAGDGVLTDVVADVELPSGLTHRGQRSVRLSFGTLGAANVARESIAVDVDHRALDTARVEQVATARDAEGHVARSQAAVTDVSVISARTVEAPADEPAAPAPVVAAPPTTTPTAAVPTPAADAPVVDEAESLPAVDRAVADMQTAPEPILPGSSMPRWLVALVVATTLVALATLTRLAQRRMLAVARGPGAAPAPTAAHDA